MGTENNKKHKPIPDKAYKNSGFLNSGDARPIRILSEYLEPKSRLKKYDIKDTVVFYGSARILSKEDAKNELEKAKWKASQNSSNNDKNNDEIKAAERHIKMSSYYEDARELAFRLTKWSLDLAESQRFIVCSGGGPGIMKAANQGAMEAGGQTIGLNISIPHEQYPNPYITEKLSFEFHYFFMRKLWFVLPAKALIVFPGGFGTMDELFELLTLRQTQKITKPLCVVIYGKEYWNDIIKWEKLIDWGVISEEDLKLFNIVDSVDDAFLTLKNHFEKEFVGKKKYWHW